MVGYCTAAKRPLWATVGLCELASANVVGYNETALLGNSQAKGVGAAFLPVNGGKIKLGDIKIVGYDKDEGYSGFAITAKKLNGFGVGVASYLWCDFEEEGETYFGWYDADMNDLNDVELEPGEGLWIYSPSEEFKVQSAGTVADADVEVPLRGNSEAKMVVNPMPTTLTLGDINIIGYADDEGYSGFAITAKKLNGFGVGVASYLWCDFEEEGETYFGWYDADMNDLNEVELDPGEGLWIYSPSAEFSAVFASPLVND